MASYLVVDSDGNIVKQFFSTSPNDMPVLTAGQVAIPIDTNHPAYFDYLRYRYDGTNIVEKTHVTFTQVNSVITANGADQSVITFNGINGSATLHRSWNVPIEMNESDPVLEFSTNVPGVYTGQILDAYHYSDEFVIEAVL